MTWLAILLKPLLAPLIVFCFALPARWGAVAVWKWMPDGRLRRLLLRRLDT
jgi:hypothetical protein